MTKEKKSIDQALGELNNKIRELTEGWQRTQADFINYKKVVQEEKNNLIKAANTRLIEDLLPVLDNFQLAAKHVPDDLKDNNWAIGIQQIERQLENILASEGLERIASVGQQFNPEYHEAIEHIPSEEPEDIIIEEVQSGYKYDGYVLRPARVKVSSGKEEKAIDK